MSSLPGQCDRAPSARDLSRAPGPAAARPALFLLFPTLLLSILCCDALRAGTWSALERATPFPLKRLHFVDSRRGWIAGDGGTILKTTDGGDHWERQTTGFPDEIVDVFMLDEHLGWALGSIRFADTASWYGTKVLKTTNGGDSWVTEPPPGAGKYYNRVVFADSLRGWLCGAYGDLLMTSDGGSHWTEADVDSGPRWFWPLINMKFLTRETGYAMGGTWDLVGLLWKTTDGGAHWAVQQVSPEPVYDIHFRDSLHMIGIIGDLDYGVSMIGTSDGGTTWNYRFLGMPGLPTALSFRTEDEGWAALGFPGTLLTTTNAGETWSTVPTPGGIPVYDLAFTDSSTGFAVGDSGLVLRYASDPVAEVATTPSGSRTTLTLGDAYPDPWNGTTRFTYVLAAETNVRLTLYTMLGQEIRRLAEGRQEPGAHTVAVDGSGLASGVYLYVLEAGGSIAVRKCMLTR